MNNDLKKLNDMPIWKSVLSNSVPAMLAMIMMLIYNMADLFFVGQTGDTLQVSAVSLASPIFLFFMAIGTIFGVGGTSVISRLFGSGEHKKAKSVSAFCLWATIGIGTIISLLVFFNTQNIMKLLGASTEVSTLVSRYLRIICISGPFIMISSCLSNLVRAEGKAKNAMMGMMLGNIINIILDPIFILTLDLGVTGAAIATVIGNISGSVYFLYQIMKKESLLSGNIKHVTLDSAIIKPVLLIGIPASLSSILMSVSQVVLNNQMAHYGDLAVAGVGVASKVSMMTGVLFIGLGQGIQPLLGYTIGAADEKRYKGILRFSCILAFTLSATVTLLCYFNLEGIVGSFLEDPEAFVYAYSFSKTWLTTSVLFGVFYVLLNALQAAGAVKASLLVNVSRQGLIFIPAVLILGAIYGEIGLIIAQPVADICSFIMVVVLYRMTSKNIFKTAKAY